MRINMHEDENGNMEMSEWTDYNVHGKGFVGSGSAVVKDRHKIANIPIKTSLLFNYFIYIYTNRSTLPQISAAVRKHFGTDGACLSILFLIFYPSVFRADKNGWVTTRIPIAYVAYVSPLFLPILCLDCMLIITLSIQASPLGNTHAKPASFQV